MADAVVELARHRCEAGGCAEALPLARRAERIYRAEWGEDHPWTAGAQTLLARGLIAAGELDEAERVLATARATLEERLPEGHPDIAPTHLYRGDLERARGRPERARIAYESAIRVLSVKLPGEHPRIAEARERIAGL